MPGYPLMIGLTISFGFSNYLAQIKKNNFLTISANKSQTSERRKEQRLRNDIFVVEYKTEILQKKEKSVSNPGGAKSKFALKET